MLPDKPKSGFKLPKTELRTSYHGLPTDGSGEDALQLEDDSQRVVIGQPELQAAAKNQRFRERGRCWAAWTRNSICEGVKTS